MAVRPIITAPDPRLKQVSRPVVLSTVSGDFDVMGDYLIEISELEKNAVRELNKINWNP